MPGTARTVAEKGEGAARLLPRRAPLVDELHDADGDGAEQEDVYEPLPAQDEFSHEPRGEQRRGQQTDVQVNPSNPERHFDFTSRPS